MFRKHVKFKFIFFKTELLDQEPCDHVNKCVSAKINLDYSFSLKRLGQKRLTETRCLKCAVLLNA